MRGAEESPAGRRLQKQEIDVLRPLRAAYLHTLKELKALERRRASAARSGESVVRALFRVEYTENDAAQEKILTQRLLFLQQEFLAAQVLLERKIAAVPDGYIRLVLSLYYVDLLRYKDIADLIGGISGGAVQQLLSRYFAGAHEGIVYDSSGNE